VSSFTIEELANEFRQGEIISNLLRFDWDPTTGEHGDVLTVKSAYSVVVSQDCDLLQDFIRRRDTGLGDISGVLLCEAETWDIVKARPTDSDIMRRIKKQFDPRYHLLDEVLSDIDQCGLGIPSLILDFKRLYTVTIESIGQQCAHVSPFLADRRCRLKTPYREHLQHRLASYLQRIALPDT